MRISPPAVLFRFSAHPTPHLFRRGWGQICAKKCTKTQKIYQRRLNLPSLVCHERSACAARLGAMAAGTQSATKRGIVGVVAVVDQLLPLSRPMISHGRTLSAHAVVSAAAGRAVAGANAERVTCQNARPETSVAGRRIRITNTRALAILSCTLTLSTLGRRRLHHARATGRAAHSPAHAAVP